MNWRALAQEARTNSTVGVMPARITDVLSWDRTNTSM